MNIYAKSREIEGKQWRWIYLDIPAGLSEADCDSVAEQAIYMHVKKKKSMRVKGEGYEGVMNRLGHGVIGSFVGTELEARLETDAGKTHMSILAEPVPLDSRLN
jgi:hypothetical protein